jgi:hypothetical protein
MMLLPARIDLGALFHLIVAARGAGESGPMQVRGRRRRKARQG